MWEKSANGAEREGGARRRLVWCQNTRRHEPLASFVPSRVFRIGLPRHCASTRYRSSIDTGLWRIPVRAGSPTHHPAGSGHSPLKAHEPFRRLHHNRGVEGRQDRLLGHCWLERLGRRASDRAPFTAYGSVRSGLAPALRPPPALSLHLRRILCSAGLPAPLLTRFRPGAVDLASDPWAGLLPPGSRWLNETISQGFA